jgi:Rrf2 family protein
MKIPAKIEYAYKAVLELALRYNKENPVQINTICEAQVVPKKFLIHLLLRLKNANIVNSSRGASGGYYLSRPPSQISLADVFKAVDDTIISGQKKAQAGRRGQDSNRELWKIWAAINRDIEDNLKEVTFDKLISHINSDQLTYNI